ncbi:MAG: type II toxin-antitoxin system death-on-curing family toxin [Oscillospiraceae bacterium]|nr:type II toxin-antitoxin system death-on-curing family toxin [Oscillospiraceae bacterium]
MIAITIEEIILLHEKLINTTGGSPGLRDYGLLESAVLGCYQSFGGQDLYPTIIEKAARLSYFLCNNHAFVDGNKRIAVTSMLVFLRMNDIKLIYTQAELITLGLGMANGSINFEDVLAWISVHI